MSEGPDTLWVSGFRSVLGGAQSDGFCLILFASRKGSESSGNVKSNFVGELLKTGRNMRMAHANFDCFSISAQFD